MEMKGDQSKDSKNEKNQENINLEDYASIDVPGDGNCLFWAASFAYLVLAVNDAEQFNKKLLTLFDDVSHYNDFLTSIENLLTGNRYEIVSHLGNSINNFRLKIVEHMKNHQTDFEEDVMNEEKCFENNERAVDYNDYLEKMKSSFKYGGLPEIKAISQLLKCCIIVRGKYFQTFDNGNELILLFHVNENHFKFGVLRTFFAGKKMSAVRKVTRQKISKKKAQKNYSLPLKLLFNEYASTGLKTSLHGDIYQLKLLLLFLKRGLEFHQNFCLGTEVPAGSIFDDLVFIHRNDAEIIKDENKKIHIRFLQAKHSYVEKLNYSALTSKDGIFSLRMYYLAYKKIKRGEFKKYTLDSYCICTNVSMEENDIEFNGFVVKRIDKGKEAVFDQFFDSKKLKNTVKRYQLQVEKNHQFFDTLKNTTSLQQLAYKLAECFFNGRPKLTKGNMFKFNDFLMIKENVMERSDRGTKYCITLTKEFLNKDESLPGLTKKFYEHFQRRYGELHKKSKKSIEEIWNELHNKPAECSQFFGMDTYTQEEWNSHERDLPLEEEDEIKEIENFFNDLFFAITPNEIILGKMIARELGDKFDLIDADIVSNHMLVYVLNWMKHQKSRYIHDDEVKKIYQQMKEKISKLMASGLNSEYCQRLLNSRLSFSTRIGEVDNFLASQTQFIFSLITPDPFFGAAKVLQSLQNIKAKFKKQDSFMIIPLITLAHMNEVIIAAFQSTQSNFLLVVVDENNVSKRKTLALCENIFKIIDSMDNKKVIFISDNNTIFSNERSIACIFINICKERNFENNQLECPKTTIKEEDRAQMIKSESSVKVSSDNSSSEMNIATSAVFSCNVITNPSHKWKMIFRAHQDNNVIFDALTKRCQKRILQMQINCGSHNIFLKEAIKNNYNLMDSQTLLKIIKYSDFNIGKPLQLIKNWKNNVQNDGILDYYMENNTVQFIHPAMKKHISSKKYVKNEPIEENFSKMSLKNENRSTKRASSL